MELLRPGWIPRLSALLALALLPRGALGSCGTPPKLSFAELQDESKAKEEFPVGTTVTYNCRPGYQRVAGQSPTLTCEEKSVWSEPKMFCQGKSCGHPRDLANGKVHITDLLFGSNITFSCDEGFRLVGHNTSLCVIDGTRVTWNHELPFCEAIPCHPPPDIKNGRHSGDSNTEYTYGSTVTYSCNTVPRGTDPFSLIGEASIHCTSDKDQNGIWSGEPPQCKVVKCSNAEVENGRKLSGFGPSYSYQDAIIFECEAGYFMVGSHMIVCQANNLWSPPVPTCEKEVCPDLVISHGRVKSGAKPHYVVGDHVTIECYAAYTMPGEPTIHCTDKFKWEPVIPECRLQVCPDLVISHGRVKSGAKPHYVVGDHVTIECYAAYTMPGEPTIHCTDKFKWEPVIPECRLRVYIIIICGNMSPLHLLLSTPRVKLDCLEGKEQC
nr:membrane cofactor protein-like isoform X6 [Caretta caretta]